jgi:hypothetical protein
MGLGVGAVVMAGAACGGIVVIDPSGEGGSGGAPAQTTTTTVGPSGGLGGGFGCGAPPPVGSVTECSAGATTGSGAPVQCDTFYCDEGSNTYTVQCTGTTCACLYQAQTLCSCAIDGPGDICAGTAEPCCPFPFVE